MFENFAKLPQEKRDHILTVCIEEFAEYGYQEASTNRIVEKAGISKGILFHYFGNKKNLFFYLYDYVMNYYEKEAESYAAGITTDDFFERLKQWSLVKIQMSLKTPQMTDFLTKSILTLPDDLKQELHQRYARIAGDNMRRFTEGLNPALFRTGVDIKKAMEIIMYFRDGMGQRIFESYRGRESELRNDYGRLLADFDEYFDILKYGFYRQK